MDNMKIINKLRAIIKNPISELEYADEFQLLVAVILSAQCTDKRVNIVTKELFRRWGTPMLLASAPINEVEDVIKPCGFYHNKSKNIIECSRQIIEKHNGQVPSELSELVSLSGVGRKTANVVLAVAFGRPAIPVDTHVFRVSRRLGLSESDNVKGVEKDLMMKFDEKDWSELHHLILLFGRYYCTARKPKCDNCVLKEICKYKGGNLYVDGQSQDHL